MKLFQEDGIPDGVSLEVLGTMFDYKSYLLMAKNERFYGNCIYTNDNNLHEVNIHHDDISETLPFYKQHIYKNIEIDGDSNFLSFTIPASKTLLFQLKECNNNLTI